MNNTASTDEERQDEKVVENLQPIVFYCKDCKEIVTATKQNKSLTFVCPKCSQSNISIGTKKSIENFYRLNK